MSNRKRSVRCKFIHGKECRSAAQGALVCAPQSDSIRKELIRRRKIGESIILDRLKRAKAEGDLPLDADPAQFGALKTGRGKHRKYAPYVFTEQGAPYRAVYVARQAVSMSSARTSKFMQNAISTWPTHMISVPNRDGNARSP
jgi:hypothetical protein